MKDINRIFEQYSRYFETSFALYKQKELIYGNSKINQFKVDFMINSDYYCLYMQHELSNDQIQIMKIGLISVLEINVPKTHIKDHFRNIVNNQANYDDISLVNDYLGSAKFFALMLIKVEIEYDILYTVLNNLVTAPVIMIMMEGNYLVCFKTNDKVDSLIIEINNLLETEIMVKNQLYYMNNFTNINDINYKYKELIDVKRLASTYMNDTPMVKKEDLSICRMVDNVDVSIVKDILFDMGFNIGYRIEDIPDIQSIYCFMRNNLNIAETARELYIHRNTLIYRLDKFYQITNIDLRKFNDAMKFAIILMLQQSLNNRTNN